MKNKLKSKSSAHMLGLCLIALAGVISNSACFIFIGEPDAPKSLLK